MTLLEMIPKEHFSVFLRYADGESGTVDLSSLVGRGVFADWENPDRFQQGRLADGGYPEWPGGIDLCPDALYLKLTGKEPEEVFPSLKRFQVHA